MKLDIKKLLLAGTAIVAVGATPMLTPAAMAADELVIDTNASGTFTTTGDDETADGPNTGAAFDWGTNVNAITTAAKDVRVDANAFIDLINADVIGDGNGNAITANATGFTLQLQDAGGDDGALEAATINGHIDHGTADAFSLTILGVDDGNGADTFDVNVNGNIDLGTGTLTITADQDTAGNDVTLGVTGNITAATISLDDDAAGSDAVLELKGTSAQVITANIAAAADNEGNISVQNAAGVTFAGTIGATNTEIQDILIANTDGKNSAATFQKQVDVNGNITLGNGTGTDTNTVTFDSSGASFAVNSTLVGTANDTDNVVVMGGNTVTQAQAWSTNLDKVTITGNSTLVSAAAITVTDITVESGSTLEQGADAIGANIANAGVIKQTGTGAINGNITGAGTLDIDENATYTGNVAGTSADIATGKKLTFGGTNAYSVGTTTLTGTGAIEFGGAAQTVSGAIAAAATGNGKVDIADNAATVAFTNDIGTSSVKVGALNVTGTTGQAVTTTGNLYVDTITLHDANTLSFIGTSAQTVSGAIAQGDINVGTGATASDVTFMGAITSGDALTVNDTAKATFADDAAFSGALSADKATLEVAAGKTLTVGTQTAADVTTWNVNVNKVGGGAQTTSLYAAGDAFDLSADTVHFVVNANSAPLTTGTSVLNDVFAGVGGSTVAGATVTDNSFIYGFELVAETTNVDVTVSVENSIENVTTNSGYDATGNQLITTLAASTNTEVNQLQSTLAAASTKSAANDVIEAAASDVSGGAVVAGVQVAGSTSAINNDRLASLRSGETGMNAGQVMHGLNAWIQGFGSQGQQDERDGVSGYDADTYGFAVGFDTQELAQDITVGLSFAYADTEVDSDAISNANTEVDSYQISLYGDYDLNETVFVSGQLGYIWSDNDTTRNPGGISSLSAKGSYNADAFVAGLAVGRDYHTGHGTLVLTPKVSADYMHYSADSYTETGAGGANLTVDSDSLNMFEIGLGVEAEWDIQNANGSHLMPSIGLGVRHDLIGDEFEASNKFAGGGTAFKVKGFDPAQTTFDAGLGVKYITDTNWTLSAGYNFEFKSDYDSHAGMVKASYKF